MEKKELENFTIYDTNNSGGSWWLNEEDWMRLEKAGWIIEWKKEDWLGTKATRALFLGSYSEAVHSFETVLGMNADEEGCPCCGQPHSFSEPWNEDALAAFMGPLELISMIGGREMKKNSSKGDKT